MRSILTLGLFLAIFFQFSSGRHLSECEVARELVSEGISRRQIDDWVCLVMSESSGNTKAVNNYNSDGSKDWGLFQINDRYWCAHGHRGGGCNIECQQLMSSSLSVSVNCAQLIYNSKHPQRGGRFGFEAWEGWKSRCADGAPSMDHCFGPSGGSSRYGASAWS